jgi:hypothetical protein
MRTSLLRTQVIKVTIEAGRGNFRNRSFGGGGYDNRRKDLNNGDCRGWFQRKHDKHCSGGTSNGYSDVNQREERGRAKPSSNFTKGGGNFRDMSGPIGILPDEISCEINIEIWKDLLTKCGLLPEYQDVLNSFNHGFDQGIPSHGIEGLDWYTPER